MRGSAAVEFFVGWLVFVGWLTGETGWGSWLWGLVPVVLIGAGWGAADLSRHPPEIGAERHGPGHADPDEHSRGLRFLELKIPDHFMFQFQTKRGTWMEQAVCLAKHFNRLEDGSYVGDAGGSPIWFRCVEHHDDHFVHVDGEAISISPAAG